MILRRATDEYRGCVEGVMVMSRRCRGDVLTKSWRWYSALWRAYKRWWDFTWSHIPRGCRMISWMKKISLLFCCCTTGWIVKIKHAGESIAISSPMLRRAVREHRRWITQTIGDTITSNIHRRCSRTWREHHRCVADVSAIFWTLVYLSESSPTVVRWSALFGDISRMVLDDEISGANFNACIQIFLDIPMPWWNMAIPCVRCQSFAEQLVHRGAALAMPKFVHRKSIQRRGKSLVGP